ncbi:MAG: 4Fe-4S dicluster domain-containing protein [Bacteroidales bacterium]|nr:4Fe-4S dicluster domain-containing protein [Bacteroidales bacterium]
MIDFGFSRHKSSTINLDEVDLSLYHSLEKTNPDIRTCISCGSCSATCIAAKYSGMSIRKVIHSIQRGGAEDASAMVANCMLCGKCNMVCPRGINTRQLVLNFCRIFNDGEK